MVNLIKAELFKLRKDRAFRLLLLVLAVLALAYPFLGYYDDYSDGDPITVGAEYLLDTIAFNSYIIKLILPVLAGFFIASEYTTGVMKTIASSGSGRGRLFSAKLIGYSVGAMALSLIFPLICTFVASLLGGFGHLPAEYPDLFVLRALGLTLLYATGYAAITTLFTMMLTESGKTIGFSIIFFLMIDSILPGLGTYMPFLNTVYDYSVFKLLNEIGVADMSVGTVPLLLVPLLTIAVSGLLGYLVFRRKEIK